MSRARRRRRAPSPRRQAIGGLAVLLVLAVAVYAVFIRQFPWSQHWTLRAIFSNSAQITAGSPVRIAGLTVGQVSAVGQGPGTTAIVTMQIGSSGRPIHTDATAAIRPRLFLEGSYYVELHPGSPSAPTLGDGRTLSLSETSVPVSFSSVLSTLTRPVRTSLVDIVDGFARGFGHGGAADLGSGLHALGPAFKSGAIASQALVGTSPGDVERLVQGADRVTQALADVAPQLREAIGSEADVAATLAARDGDLTASIRGVDATLRAAPPALSALTQSLPVVQRFAIALDPSLRRAPAVLSATTALLAQAQALVARPALPQLISILGPLSDQVVALAPKLEDLFPRVAEVSSCTANQVVDLLDTKLQDGTLSTGQPVWQELAHVNVGLASANQDFDAAGTRVRFATSLQPNLLGLGSVPGAGVLLQNVEQPVLGIRPQWSGPTPPPVHPEVPCTSQPLGDLQAASTAVPAPSTRAQLNVPVLGRLVSAMIARARRGQPR